MNGRAVLGLLLLLGTSACFDKQAATSGQIGCAPSEVEISDEGSGYASETWTATCHGEQYYCSRVGTGKDTSQVNCHAASAPPASTTKPAEAQGVAGGAPAAPAEREPPAAVAGFTFGSSVTEASSACTEHGYEWQPGARDHFRCSGTPVSIGADAVPTLRFCEAKLCAISLHVAFPNAWLQSYARLSQVLTKKYGKPSDSKGEPRSNCATETQFEACIMTEGLKLVRDWKWNTGTGISLRLAAGQSAPEMTIIYVHREQPEVIPDAL